MIIRKKNLQGGMPVVRGTRLTVWEILQALSDGYSIKDIVIRCRKNDVPVSEKDIKEAIDYASRTMEAI